tara:strand:- start:11809 stop:12168 length:360 start_codon:yes stop_codon:yes gene_type:complete
MNKIQLNKKLNSRILSVRETDYLKDCKIRVIRARNNTPNGGNKTEVDIRVYARVKSTVGQWLPVTMYGPRIIRKFIRKQISGSVDTPNYVNEWTKLWGFPSDRNIKISTIELVHKPSEL